MSVQSEKRSWVLQAALLLWASAPSAPTWFFKAAVLSQTASEAACLWLLLGLVLKATTAQVLFNGNEEGLAAETGMQLKAAEMPSAPWKRLVGQRGWQVPESPTALPLELRICPLSPSLSLGVASDCDGCF